MIEARAVHHYVLGNDIEVSRNLYKAGIEVTLKWPRSAWWVLHNPIPCTPNGNEADIDPRPSVATTNQSV